jgi:hypothetical protein
VFWVLQKSVCAWAFAQQNSRSSHTVFAIFIYSTKSFCDKDEMQYYLESLCALQKCLIDNIPLSKMQFPESGFDKIFCLNILVHLNHLSQRYFER